MHVALQTHRPFVTIAQQDRKLAKQAAKLEAQTNGDATKPPGDRAKTIEELWKPAGQNVAFFEAAGIR